MKAVAICAVCAGVSALRAGADSVAEATYQKLFDRAQVLIPGVTILEKRPAKDGEIALVGGTRVSIADGIAFEAEGDRWSSSGRAASSGSCGD